MTIKRLGSNGVAHFVLPLLVVVGVAIGGMYYLISSYADTCNVQTQQATLQTAQSAQAKANSSYAAATRKLVAAQRSLTVANNKLADAKTALNHANSKNKAARKAAVKAAQIAVTKAKQLAASAQKTVNSTKADLAAKNQAVAAAILALQKCQIAQSSSSAAPLDKTVESMNKELSRYGVTVTISPPNNKYTYSKWSTLKPADASTLQIFSTYLIQEFSKYPKSLVTNSGLKTIGLVKDLKVSGTARAAAPAPGIKAMIYDVNMMTKAGSDYAREVVSHEYWHYLDYKVHGSYTYKDAAWSACNPRGFTYGAGGVTAYDPSTGYVSAFHPQAGFITEYSKYGIEEDRAEMFGWLMSKPSTVKGLNDSKITCKIKRLTVLVHKLSPSMNF
ncbi:hypothetical protein BH09PAT4_BH09PAT4_01070 [soil metagenome]